MDILKRLAGAVVSGGVTFLATQGVTLSPELQTTIMLTVYAFVHKALDRFI